MKVTERFLRALLIGSLCTYAGVLATSSPGYRPLRDLWLYNLVTAAAAGLCLLRAVASRPTRTAWAALGASLGALLLGDIYYGLALSQLDEAPYPSFADWCWLAFFPLAYLGLILLLRAENPRFHASYWLDGLVGALGAAALADALALKYGLTISGGELSVVVTNLAYPVGDLLLLVIVVGSIGLLRGRARRTWWILAAGLAVFAVADSGYAVQVAKGTYVDGKWLDLLWPVAVTLVAAASWQPTARGGIDGSAAREDEGFRIVAVPAVFALTSLGLLVYGQQGRLASHAGYLAAACLLAGAVRALLTLRELAALADARRDARTDELTGLRNRRYFRQLLRESLAGRAEEEQLALLLVDLDRFKDINDALGHSVGDDLLRMVASRLRRSLRNGEVLARLGGDEFSVLLHGASGEEAEAAAQRMLQALSEPFHLNGMSLLVGASIGVTLAPEDTTDSDALLQYADVAMYQVKSRGGGSLRYSAGRDLAGPDRLRRLEQLREALRVGQLELHYQPKVELATGRVDGVEALVRWNSPQHGLLLPASFLPLAEQTGLMRLLTQRVLDLALVQCRAWREQGMSLRVAVNLSASNLLDLDLPDQVADRLERSRLPGDALTLEITESTLMSDPPRALAVLTRLRAMGVSVSMDDYGTGYSSLAYLRDLPLDELKLDRSFVAALVEGSRAAAIVRCTVDLAHSLSLSMVAEGVESVAAAELLAGYGCDVAQGHYLAEPMPADALGIWLAGRRPPAMPVKRLRSVSASAS